MTIRSAFASAVLLSLFSSAAFAQTQNIPSNIITSGDREQRVVRPGGSIDDLLRPGGSIVTDGSAPAAAVPASPSYVAPTPASAPQTGPVASEGAARVVSGGVVVVDGYPYILDGLAGPSADETCVDLAGLSWKCGLEAGRRLERIIDSRKVRCVGESSEDEAEAATGTCFVGREDIGRILVLDGFAASNGRYASEEATARSNNRGIWGVGANAYPR